MLASVERLDVGGLIRIGLQAEIESRLHVRLLDQLVPHRARPAGLEVELVVLHAADHVEVEVGLDVGERDRRLRRERGGAEQAELLARPEVEDQVPAALFLRERVGDAQHGRRARGVVVGAAMHASGFLLRRERQAVGAGPEMVVVRAEGDPRLRTRRRRRRRGQIAADVAAGARLAHDRGVHRRRRRRAARSRPRAGCRNRATSARPPAFLSGIGGEQRVRQRRR